jgi:tRNA threonylcarbamoyladenosine biosynthesis protein TsaB
MNTENGKRRLLWTIGIETSGREGSVALLREDETVAERSLSHEGRRHARTLVDELRLLLSEAGVSPQNCDLIAVSQGPGSFTGLRVGIVCAKTWAYATGCQLAGVNTLLAIASAVDRNVGQVDVVVDAQRGDLFQGTYEADDDGVWKETADIRIISGEDWINELNETRAVTGSALVGWKDRVPAGVFVLPPYKWTPTAVAVARVGRLLSAAGQSGDLWSLNPIYLRKSAAEEKADAVVDRRSSRETDTLAR